MCARTQTIFRSCRPRPQIFKVLTSQCSDICYQLASATKLTFNKTHRPSLPSSPFFFTLSLFQSLPHFQLLCSPPIPLSHSLSLPVFLTTLLLHPLVFHFIPPSLKLHMVSVWGGSVYLGSAWERDAEWKLQANAHVRKRPGSLDGFLLALTYWNIWNNLDISHFCWLQRNIFNSLGITFNDNTCLLVTNLWKIFSGFSL